MILRLRAADACNKYSRSEGVQILYVEYCNDLRIGYLSLSWR